jgi:hypothetical protein
MSIVLHGLGLGDVNSGSTIVAFGLVQDLEAGQNPQEVIANAGIEQLFVIDYGSQFTRPLTEAEYRRWQMLIKMLLSGPVQFTDQKVNGKPGLKIWKEPIKRRAA